MKIALCLCPQWSLITPSFALGSLSAALEQDGHETEQIDLNLLSAYYLGNERELFWRFSHTEGPIMDGKKLQQNLKEVVKIFEKFGIVGLIKCQSLMRYVSLHMKPIY